MHVVDRELGKLLRNQRMANSETLLQSPLPLFVFYAELAWCPNKTAGISCIGISQPSALSFGVWEASSTLCTGILATLLIFYEAGTFSCLVYAIIVAAAHVTIAAFLLPYPSFSSNLVTIVAGSVSFAMLFAELVVLSRATTASQD